MLDKNLKFQHPDTIFKEDVDGEDFLDALDDEEDEIVDALIDEYTEESASIFDDYID